MKTTLRHIAIAGLMLGLVGHISAHAADDAAERNFQSKLALALANDPKGQHDVAQLYEQGAGTERDLRLAHLWYTKSANQGYAPAKQKLASWDRDRQQEAERERAAQAERTRRQAEADATARAARERAAAEARARAEAEALARASRERDAAAAAAAKPREPEPAPKPVVAEPAKPKAPVAETPAAKAPAADGKVEFSANPCKGPQARFTSTCQQ